jgi:precorrin-3B methylase
MLAVALGSARRLEAHYSESVAFELRVALRSPFIQSSCSDLLTPEQEAAYEEVIKACCALTADIEMALANPTLARQALIVDRARNFAEVLRTHAQVLGIPTPK